MYSLQDRQNTVSSAISRTSRRSDESYSSQSTAATSVCDEAGLPPLKRQLRHTSTRSCMVHHHGSYSSSRGSCSSRRPSEPELYEEPEEYGEEEYYTASDYPTSSFTSLSIDPHYGTPIPTTPQDFASYFPSQRRLTIAHDPSAADNMNLLVTTAVHSGARDIPMQLFYLRIHDIATRSISLRRYSRNSGREICRSLTQRPKFQRSMSAALAGVRRSTVKRADSWGSSKPAASTLVTHDLYDNGYTTNSDDESEYSEPEIDNDDPIPAPKRAGSSIRLEFSTYAHVDLRRRGKGANKHWDFEYWGVPYSWKRAADGAGFSYHLVPHGSTHAVAHVVPEVLTTAQARADAAEGAWVPKCSLWISDARLLKDSDVADVIVATGILSLVDDAARGGGSGGRMKKQIKVPLSPVKLDLEIVNPREMMRQVFRRGSKDSGRGRRDEERPGTARPGTARSTGSPLRYLSPVEALG